MKEYYKEVQTLEEWTETITVKFSDFPIIRKPNELTIEITLGISDPIEIEKIKKAQFIVFAKKHNVLTFENACKHLNINPIDKELFELTKNKFLVANYKLEIIIECLNNGWKPNWSDPNESKYIPVFKMPYFCFLAFLLAIGLILVSIQLLAVAFAARHKN